MITPPDQYEFTRTLPIAALNDTEAECRFGTDGGSVELGCATICGKRFGEDDLEDWLGSSEVGLLEAMARDWWMSEGWAAAEQDWLDGLGDWLFEQRRDG